MTRERVVKELTPKKEQCANCGKALDWNTLRVCNFAIAPIIAGYEVCETLVCCFCPEGCESAFKSAVCQQLLQGTMVK